MAFAGRVGLTIDAAAVAETDEALVAGLFAEELGVVLQIRSADRARVRDTLARHGLEARVVARPNEDDVIAIGRADRTTFRESRVALQRAWSETTWQMQRLRDNPACAQEEYDRILDAGDPGLSPSLAFDPLEDVAAPFVSRGARPPIAILREQGVNGQIEMAAACNGCQMMAALKAIIPGACAWPRFVKNASEQYEARLVTVEILPSPSLFFSGMHGSRIPAVVAHGEGRAVFEAGTHQRDVLVAGRFVDNRGRPAATYPLNPNGSPDGVTAVTTADGRFTILMPHPERVFRTVQMSWHPHLWGEDSPWMRIFRNARAYLG